MVEICTHVPVCKALGKTCYIYNKRINICMSISYTLPYHYGINHNVTCSKSKSSWYNLLFVRTSIVLNMWYLILKPLERRPLIHSNFSRCYSKWTSNIRHNSYFSNYIPTSKIWFEDIYNICMFSKSGPQESNIYI